MVGDGIGSWLQVDRVKGEIKPHHWQPGLAKQGLEISPSTPSPIGRGTIAWAEKLMTRPSATGVDGNYSVESAGLAPAPASPNRLSAADLAVATLPAALFYHESSIKLKQALQAAGLQFNSGLPEALVFGFTISQLLQERFDPACHILQTIAFLKQSTPDSAAAPLELIEALERVQDCLKAGADLRSTVSRITLSRTGQTSQKTAALSLACFLQSPDTPQTAILRATQTGYALPSLCAWVGALAGAQNGITGFPPEWRLGWAFPETASEWAISGADLRLLGTRLLAAWSGVYMPLSERSHPGAIAAPGLIRPR
jgi:hypothetical protein